MKRLLLLFFAMILSMSAWCQLRGDLNDDKIIDVTDVNELIDIVLGREPQAQIFTVDGVSFVMVPVEGGRFSMGATAEQGDDAYIDELPAHEVTLDDYAIGAFEVTQELWQAVMGYNPSYFNRYGNTDYGSYHSDCDYGTDLQRPVECVNWDECQAFIAKLNQLTGKNFRLPTEAEWEYAARGGNKRQGNKYAGGNTIDGVAWYWNVIPSQTTGTRGYGTQAVASKAPNELGVYDMNGNVCEWCQDWYGEYRGDEQANPAGSSSGMVRVLRGGGWDYDAKNCRVTVRIVLAPDDRDYDIGLRLAL